LATAKAGPLL